jgi:hypothetical protein
LAAEDGEAAGARAQVASIESRYCGVMPASLRILP